MATVALIAGTTAVASGGVQAYQMREARQDQQEAASRRREAAREEKRKAALQNARQRRRARAQSRIQQEQLRAQSEARGASSTGTQVSMGALQSQTESNVSFQRSLGAMSNNIIDLQSEANQFQGQAREHQAWGNFATQMGMTPGNFLSMMD